MRTGEEGGDQTMDLVSVGIMASVSNDTVNVRVASLLLQWLMGLRR